MRARISNAPHHIRLWLELFVGLALSLFDQILLFGTPIQPVKNRILIVRLDLIGDFILWLAAARFLVDLQKKQGSYVILLANQSWSAWAQQMGLGDEVWSLDAKRFRRNIIYRFQWLRKVRKAGFSIAIHPAYTRVFRLGDAFIQASQARERIGFSAGSVNRHPVHRMISNRWYTKLVHASPETSMEILRNAEFIHGLGHKDFLAEIANLESNPTKILSIVPSLPYAVLFPVSSWKGKQWPPEHFVEIGKRLRGRGVNVVVAGGKADQEITTMITSGMGHGVVDLAGKVDLPELSEILRRATIVFANDSGVVHIAAATRTPTVCIVGGGHPGRFFPYPDSLALHGILLPIAVSKPMPCFGCGWKCIFPRRHNESVKCIRDVSVQQAWIEIENRVLSKRPKLPEELLSPGIT